MTNRDCFPFFFAVKAKATACVWEGRAKKAKEQTEEWPPKLSSSESCRGHEPVTGKLDSDFRSFYFYLFASNAAAAWTKSVWL